MGMGKELALASSGPRARRLSGHPLPAIAMGRHAAGWVGDKRVHWRHVREGRMKMRLKGKNKRARVKKPAR